MKRNSYAEYHLKFFVDSILREILVLYCTLKFGLHNRSLEQSADALLNAQKERNSSLAQMRAQLESKPQPAFYRTAERLFREWFSPLHSLLIHGREARSRINALRDDIDLVTCPYYSLSLHN